MCSLSFPPLTTSLATILNTLFTATSAARTNEFGAITIGFQKRQIASSQITNRLRHDSANHILLNLQALKVKHVAVLEWDCAREAVRCDGETR